ATVAPLQPREALTAKPRRFSGRPKAQKTENLPFRFSILKHAKFRIFMTLRSPDDELQGSPG
ncbi:MAG: hypothetical protein K2G86_09295, partial [Prevotella sp.]|nr:hypothetical protein [Prevotella sp.]